MKKSSVILMAVLVMLLSGCAEKTQSEQTIGHSFLWGGTICQGIYNGSVKDQRPDGEGEFHGYIMREGKPGDEVTYEGEWKSGKLNGIGIFTNVTEGISYEGTFAKNVRSGEFVVRRSGSEEYEAVAYKKDVPYGIVDIYDEAGQIVGYDRYYLGKKVSELIAAAKLADYNELIYDIEEHYYEKVYLDGVVETKMVEEEVLDSEEEPETEDYAQVSVKDSEGNRYLLKYSLEYHDDVKNYMPSLEIGEEVRVYGYVKGITEERETVRMDGVCPIIEGVAVQHDMENVKREEIPLSYENFVDYAYEFEGQNVELSGTIQGVINEEQGKIYLLVESDDYSPGEKKVYICIYNGDVAESSRIVPKVGVEIKLKGVLQNIYAASRRDEFQIYPKVYVNEVG